MLVPFDARAVQGERRVLRRLARGRRISFGANVSTHRSIACALRRAAAVCMWRPLGRPFAFGSAGRRLLGAIAVFAWVGCEACSPRGCGTPPCPPGAVLIPAGTFEMGTNVKIWPMWQLKPRKVTLTRPFCMDQTEVTHGAYASCRKGGGCPAAKPGFEEVKQQFRLPKDLIDWEEAVAFCRWRKGRLPTEAEWEFAARGTDGRLYPWGNEKPTRQYWPGARKRDEAELVDVGTHPKGRSFFGLDDMTGNVKEWVADPCGMHDTKPDADPKGPDFLYTDHLPCHIVRGAAWSAVTEDWAAATFRQYASLGGDSQTGFRCAYEPR